MTEESGRKPPPKPKEPLIALAILVALVGSVLLSNHIARVEGLTNGARLSLIGVSITVLFLIYFRTLTPEERAARLRPGAKRTGAAFGAPGVPVSQSSSGQPHRLDAASKRRLLLRLAIPWVVLGSAFYLSRVATLSRAEKFGILVTAAVICIALQFLNTSPQERARFKSRRNIL
jgi:hypothetical protein